MSADTIETVEELTITDAPCQQCEGFCSMLGRDVKPHHRRLCGTGSIRLRRAMAGLPPLSDPIRPEPPIPKSRKPRRVNQSFTSRKPGFFTHTCRYLGEIIAEEPCTCGGSTKIPVYRCNSPDNKTGKCVRTAIQLGKIAEPDTRSVLTACSTCPLKEMTPQFVTTDQLWEDVKNLVSVLPPNVTRIVGVARSGVNVASMLAMLLHTPFSIVRQSSGDIIDAGSGWRLWEGAPKEEGVTLVVDDTCMTGNSLKHVKPLVEKEFANVKTATVYVNPFAAHKPDFYSRDLPWPHVLEWNVFNSVNTPACAFDFDGILCEDCPPRDDNDGGRYERWMRNVKPKYYVRKTAIPLIVTARLEKYREITLDWLERHGMRVNQLIMGPWESLAERRKSDVGAWKGEHYKKFLATRTHINPKLFIESDEHQAKRIADVSGGIVACPAAKRCFP